MAIIRHQKLLLCGVLLCAAAAAPAQAARDTSCQAPPGRAGIEQYCETLPGPTGDSGPRDKGRSRAGAVPRGARRSLARSGTAGRDLLELADSGSDELPGTANGSSRGGKSDRSTRNAADAAGGAPDSTSFNPLSAVRSGVESGTSAGPGFVWLLVGIVLFFAGLGWVRYRRRGQAG
jgi:hypothetical protein